MNKKRWLTVGIIGAVLIAAFLIVSRLNSTSAEAADAQDVATAVAFTGDLSASATASGQLLPQREAILGANNVAQVTDVAVRIGDSVQAGDIMVQLETAALQLDVDNAQQHRCPRPNAAR